MKTNGTVDATFDPGAGVISDILCVGTGCGTPYQSIKLIWVALGTVDRDSRPAVPAPGLLSVIKLPPRVSPRQQPEQAQDGDGRRGEDEQRVAGAQAIERHQPPRRQAVDPAGWGKLAAHKEQADHHKGEGERMLVPGRAVGQVG